MSKKPATIKEAAQHLGDITKQDNSKNKMRIEVIKNIDKHNRQVWSFSLFDTKLVLSSYTVESKPPRKRKWRIVNIWSTYTDIMRNYGEDQKLKEPELQRHIKAAAIKELNKQISCLTWSEYKK